MIKCLILDLDGTLVNTSALEDMRSKGLWKQIPAHFNLCSKYDELTDLIDTARSAGIKICIFTNSPSTYARQLITYFELTIDYLVGYHDVRNHKPHAEGIHKILERYDLKSFEAVYVGDNDDDYTSARAAGVEFFSVDWGIVSSIPAHNHGLNNLFGYLGKGFSSQLNNSFRTNLIQSGNHFFLGYYLSAIKIEVWAFKDRKLPAVDRWVNKVSEVANKFPKVDFVIRALGHAEKNVQLTNHNSALDQLGISLAKALNATYKPECLIKTRELVKSSKCTRQERIQQVKGAYRCSPGVISPNDYPNLTFLVIDDVFTSGSTTNDIKRALTETYPNSRIYVFTLVKTLYQSQGKPDSIEARHNIQLFNDLYSDIEPDIDRFDYPVDNKKSFNLVSKQFSANYSQTNHNFVIQNLMPVSIAAESGKESVLNAVYILKNMLQRGKPTSPSRRLTRALGHKVLSKTENSSKALISKTPIIWNRLIRGDSRTGSYPAKHFFDALISKYFGQYEFLKQLTIPEVKIFEMTQVFVERYNNRQVDFYIPQVGLIVEIDGQQHSASLDEDQKRDDFTKTLGLKTVRFSTDEIYSENGSFNKKISEILAHIKMVDDLEQRGVLSPPNGLTLEHYRRAYKNGIDPTDTSVRLCAAIRFQLLVLELIERGQIRLNEPTTIKLLNRDKIEFADAAIEDLAEYLCELMILMGQPDARLDLQVKEISSHEFNNLNNELLVDFSIFERFDDDFQTNQNVIYVRTHYLDFYRYFPQGDAISHENCELIDYDFFEMSCSNSIEYKLDLSSGSRQRDALRFFLTNLFFPFKDQIDFREGQIGIIGSALSRRGTVGLLPTGSGKSVCYQLAAILQPAISFVVCPIKSLMYDQKADLDSIGFTRTNYITSDLKADQKTTIQNEFGKGKYFFVFISPERFQTHGFRREMTAIALDRSFAYAVIDEAHCLSEWGHDFRTSYLNLANTIERLAPEACYIGLTATASVNVLKDIQTEFNISDDNVRTPLDYTRKELTFHVHDDKGQKTPFLLTLVREMEEKWNSSIDVDSENKAGIIFTPTVNGSKGCYWLSSHLSTQLEMDVRYFSGSPPKLGNLSGSAFDTFKQNVQNDFKNNKYRLLTATKAFGMGVNIGNIAYTIHYGIPSSMEALYQEAGRAGRDKKLFKDVAADCHVLLTKEPNTGVLDKIWAASTKVSELKDCVKKLNRHSDVNTNLWLMTNSLDTIKDEYNLIVKTHSFLQSNTGKHKVVITADQFHTSKFKLEKAIYRLSQLGVVKDWVIEDFFQGKLEVEFDCLEESGLRKNIETTIRKYDPNFEFDDVFNSKNEFYKLICQRLEKGAYDQSQFIFLVLLIWSYDHFVYNRRQSLKTVYEQCSELASGKIDKGEFKERLEGYFKFNESSDMLHHLAENSADINKWMDVFFEKGGTKGDRKLISKDSLSMFKDQLSRFLESYKDNICLNYLSGVVRLTSDQFDDADGEQRMAATLDRLRSQDNADIQQLLIDTLELKPFLSVESQCRFAKLFYEKFPKKEHLLLINEKFGDPYSYNALLEPLVSRLVVLTNNYRDVKWQAILKN